MPVSARLPRLLSSLPIALAVALLDQVSKRLIVDAGVVAHRVDLVGDWLALEYSENRGAAFGILRDRPEAVPLLALVVLAAVVVAYAWKRPRSAAVATAIGLIVGGAIGNMIDRVRLGFVVDFISVGPWPNFNLADSAITLGVVALIARGLLAAPDDRMPRVSEPGRIDLPGTP